MSLPAPHLKSLVFEPTLYAKHRLSVSKHLPDHPFADNAPNLRSITVCGYNNFFWGSSVLRNVSTVIIGRFDDRQIHKTEGYERPSYDRLLSALESMPQLETLHLNFCLPCGPSYGATRRLGMPSLKTLVLQDATTECLAFFRSLRVLNARVTLLLSEPREDRQLPKDIGSRTESAIHDHIPTPLLFTIDVIQLVARSSNWIYPSTSLLAGTDPRHFPGAPDMSKSRTIFSENTTALPLHLSMPNFANKDTMARTLLSMLLFVQIRVLSIDLLVRWDFKTWHHVVELFPHVEELWFSELIAVSFLEDCEASDVRSWSRLQTIRLGPFTEYFGATRGARRSLNKTLKRWHRRRRELGMEHLTISFYGMDDDDDESESDFSDSGDSGDSGDSLDDGDLYMGFAV
ncbi:hypothetical protein BC834DRAFT_640676 [Gloeopeniophorella convolvens]|nr:hypothetical protein BC834DRAFT_640676 [Gloeopeniophorella convolvens]